MKKIILLLLPVIVFSSGFVNNKKGSKTVNITDKSKYLVDTIENPYLLLNYSLDIYKETFIEKLQSTIEKGNLTLTDSDAKVIDYTLTLTKINYTESIDPQTVNDTLSEDSGKIFPTQYCSVKTETALYNAKGELVDNFVVTADDHETLTKNKDHTGYMIKSLPDNIFIRLAKNCATRTTEQALKKIQ